MKNQQRYRLSVKFLKFCIVGVINTLLNLLLFMFFFSVLKIHYIVSLILCFFIINVLTYAINKYWTFGNKRKDFVQQYFLYIVGRALSLSIGLVFTYGVVELCGVRPVISQIYVSVIYPAFNFFWANLFVFKPQPCNIDLYIENSIKIAKEFRGQYSGMIYYLVPVYREIERMQVNSPLHPGGEDFVATKIRQLDYFYSLLSPQIEYKLIFVDDGDVVENTGGVIEEYLNDNYPVHLKDGKVDVWFLSEMKPEWVDKSQKGGALLAAVEKLLNSGIDDDAIIFYTDADISSNLQQTGLLLRGFLNGADVVVSSRWNEKSTVIGRSGLAKLSSWIYSLCVWLILGLDLSDSQNGFKAYRARTICHILPYVRDLTFSFDTEWLLLADLCGYKLAETEIFWADSVTESKVNTLSDSLKMLRHLITQRNHKRKAEQL